MHLTNLYTFSLSLPNTHTPSLFVSPSLCLSCSRVLSRALSHAHTNTHTQPHTYVPYSPFEYLKFLSAAFSARTHPTPLRSLFLALSFSLYLIFSLSYSLSETHTHTHTHTHSPFWITGATARSILGANSSDPCF